MKKSPLLIIAILALGLIFTACQKTETQPQTETVTTVTDETPTVTEANNTKTLESSIFSIIVPANLIVEASEDYARIQNFTPDSDLYTLKDGEYFIEIVFNLTDETYSKDIFKDEYKKIEESQFNGKSALYGTDRMPAGDSGPGVGYYVGDNLAISIYSESESGILATKELLKSLTLK